MGRRGHPPEFRRTVLDLVSAGMPVADVARDLGISAESIYIWRRQDRIDKGLQPGLSSAEKLELTAAKRRIAELEAELANHRRASELLAGVVSPKAVRGHRGDCRRRTAGAAGLSRAGRVGVRLLRGAEPSAVGAGHSACWLTDRNCEVHVASTGTYGARRVHAELALGRGLAVGLGAVELLMARAGIRGVTGRPWWRRPRPELSTGVIWAGRPTRGDRGDRRNSAVASGIGGLSPRG